MGRHKAKDGDLEEIEFARTLGHRLAIRRQERGLTQHELAFLAGSARNQVSAYETGRIMPSPYTLFKFSKVLGVSLAYFAKPLEISSRTGAEQ